MGDKLIAEIVEAGPHGTDTEQHPTHFVRLMDVPAYGLEHAETLMRSITIVAYPNIKQAAAASTATAEG